MVKQMSVINALRRLRQGSRREVEKSTDLVREDVDKQWITKRFVIWAVFWVSIGGPAIGAIVFTFFDQSMRNIVDTWMSGPELFQHIGLNEEQYKALPLEWRQTLAEVILRPEGEAMDAKRVVDTATAKDLELIARLAPFLVGQHIARDERLLSEHPIPGVSYVDMRRLEEIGIVDDVNSGMYFTLKSNGDNPSTVRLLGTTMLIEAKGEAENIESRLELTRLTVAGETLLGGLRVPSNLAYFEWIAKLLEKDGWVVRLVVVGTDSGQDITKRTTQGIVNRDSIANWETDLIKK